MPRTALAGSRIRQRRLSLGLRQADVARNVGISPAYLNLIEHNRRRIAGKVLRDLARELDSDPASLEEGAETALLADLRAAAELITGVPVEVARSEEFVGRFPGWARLVQAQKTRIGTLERMVASLQDRLSHDPFLSTALHDMLSTVTSLHSASSILASDTELDPAWRGRFEKNIFSDSERLTEASQALVAYLDGTAEAESDGLSPNEELESALAKSQNTLAAISRTPTDDALRAQALEAFALTTPSARSLAERYLERFACDAQAMPADEMHAAVLDVGLDPIAFAQRFGVRLSAVLRRLASLSGQGSLGEVGLVIADSSGTFTYRKPIDGFDIPRFGAACPIWPLFQALSQPERPLRAVLEQTGARHSRFLSFAVAEQLTSAGFDSPAVFETTMLFTPHLTEDLQSPQMDVGPGCRVCPRESCAARREPTLFGDVFLT